jgi:transposase
MANQLKMADQKAIVALRGRGWSQRRIARELGIDRQTVSRYVKLASREPPLEAVDVGSESNPAISTVGSDSSKPAISTAGSAGRKSHCEPLREVITGKVEQGLSAQRIWQDLTEGGFAGSYESVKRFVRRIRFTRPLPFRRMECEPGAEAQIDFGSGAPIITAEGRRKKSHVFRIVLSHSRKAYSEAVFRQTTDNFLSCIENAFQHFGGVPKTLVIDNLKAAVSKADWFDPELNPKIEAFGEHYGTVILPTRPRMPRHKGKIERQVGYVQGNALKGRTFASLHEENQYLLDWETSVADTRIHGTIRKQVGRFFREVERPALQALPVERFAFFHEAQRMVHRDAHVAVDKAYYSVPPEYVGRPVWARWDTRTVRIFNQRMEQIAFYLKAEEGQFRTNPAHIASEKISYVERGTAELLGRVNVIGDQASRWAESMLAERGIQGVRVLIGLLSLAKRHDCDRIEKACETAQTHGAYRLRTIRELIKRQAPKQEQFEFMQEHPIIRSVSEYEKLVHAQWS